jgi:thioredoxin 1
MSQQTIVNVEKGKSVLYFTSNHCGPCQRIKPIYESLANQYKNQINFYKLEISENDSIADQLKVTSVPSFFFIYNGKIISKFSGANEELLKTQLNRLSIA